MSFVLSNRVLAIFLGILLMATAHANEQGAESLQLNTTLDDEGQSLQIPKDTNSDYLDNAVSVAEDKFKNEKAKKRFFKDLSRQEMLDSKVSVANDPSCRWLHQRLQFLEHKLKMGMDMHFGYHKKELKARHQEWVCLKCGVEGPSIHDYAQCQFKR
ncbi:MAG: hypothetical protein HAW66_01535 [Shewanella sp.]|nr:hypothetical protein [Shewanella sp.]